MVMSVHECSDALLDEVHGADGSPISDEFAGNPSLDVAPPCFELRVVEFVFLGELRRVGPSVR
jgi:hypothetical protein